jgi:hypothetical protein
MTFSGLNLSEDYTCNHLWLVVKAEEMLIVIFCLEVVEKSCLEPLFFGCELCCCLVVAVSAS